MYIFVTGIFLDTLIFLDYELAHVVSPLKYLDSESVAHRDMGVFLSRRLSSQKSKQENNSAIFQYDSEEKHTHLPCAFSIDSKYL